MHFILTALMGAQPITASKHVLVAELDFPNVLMGIVPENAAGADIRPSCVSWASIPILDVHHLNSELLWIILQCRQEPQQRLITLYQCLIERAEQLKRHEPG